MSEQALGRARGFLSGALTSSFEAAGAAAVAKCDYGAKNGIFAWPLAPSHFRPHSRKWTPLSLSLGVSDYSARIESCSVRWFNSRAGSVNPGMAMAAGYLACY